MLIPQGRVLFSIGRLAITEGALFAGLYRGLSVIGLVFISLFSIRRDLKLPGRIGQLIAATLSYFEQIYEQRRSASRLHLIQDMDRALYKLSATPLHITPGKGLRASDLPLILLTSGLLLLPLLAEPFL